MNARTPVILIIDNDDGVVHALATRLESAGYTCVRAGTGAQGLAAFKAKPIDLVITDLNMPAGDGVMLAREIRKTSLVPIIVVTGFREDFKRGMRGLENVAVLDKPFDSSTLLELVEAELVMQGVSIP
jgi:DNA-binding response OmpR family regulator